MQKKRFLVMAAFVSLIISGIAVGKAGATEPIKKVNIKVEVKAEAGDMPPNIGIDDKNEEVNVTSNSKLFTIEEADWSSSSRKEFKIGDEPKIKVTLSPTDEYDAYFLTSYKSNEIKISGGTYVSSRRDGSDLVVIFSIDPIKGSFNEPENAYWKDTKLGMAVWEAKENTSGVYELNLFWGNKSIHKETQLKSKSFDCYPYMTQEGDYSFRVRAVSDKSKSSKNKGYASEWVDSGDLHITGRDVSDGITRKATEKETEAGGSATDPSRPGWYKVNQNWYYRLEDGQNQKGGWMADRGSWYLFDVDGTMMTGWRQNGGYLYCLADNGEMLTGWNKLNNTWYYLSPDEDVVPLGAAVTGWWVIDGHTYFFDQNGAMHKGWLDQLDKRYYLNTLENEFEGAMLTGWIIREGETYYADEGGALLTGWNQIEGNWYYFYPGDRNLATNTSINGFMVDSDGIWRQ